MNAIHSILLRVSYRNFNNKKYFINKNAAWIRAADLQVRNATILATAATRGLSANRHHIVIGCLAYFVLVIFIRVSTRNTFRLSSIMHIIDWIIISIKKIKHKNIEKSKFFFRRRVWILVGCKRIFLKDLKLPLNSGLATRNRILKHVTI